MFRVFLRQSLVNKPDYICVHGHNNLKYQPCKDLRELFILFCGKIYFVKIFCLHVIHLYSNQNIVLLSVYILLFTLINQNFQSSFYFFISFLFFYYPKMKKNILIIEV